MQIIVEGTSRLSTAGPDKDALFDGLGHKIRRMVIRMAKELQDGVGFTEIKDATGLSTGAIYHHLEALINTNIIKRNKWKRYELTEEGINAYSMLEKLGAEEYEEENKNLESKRKDSPVNSKNEMESGQWYFDIPRTKREYVLFFFGNIFPRRHIKTPDNVKMNETENEGSEKTTRESNSQYSPSKFWNLFQPFTSGSNLFAMGFVLLYLIVFLVFANFANVQVIGLFLLPFRILFSPFGALLTPILLPIFSYVLIIAISDHKPTFGSFFLLFNLAYLLPATFYIILVLLLIPPFESTLSSLILIFFQIAILFRISIVFGSMKKTRYSERIYLTMILVYYTNFMFLLIAGL